MNNIYNNTTRYGFFIKRKRSIYELLRGVNQGVPITLGYIPVAFTFGLMAVNGGIPVWTAVLISLTNLTSAGQFAGTSLVIANGSYFEIALATFVINIRYMLMSLSLSQKISSGMPILKRCIMAFGITDEIFSVASLEKGQVSFSYMMGLTVCPYFGWALGTYLGAAITTMLPKNMQSSMGIALYGMFIALIIPSVKKSREILAVSAAAVIISSVFKFVPCMKILSSGWSIIITTIIAAAAGAVFFPREDEDFE